MLPGRKNLEFRYTGLSFLAPTRITFRYMLEGFDKDWIDAGTRREAFYTNLPPGTFRSASRPAITTASAMNRQLGRFHAGVALLSADLVLSRSRGADRRWPIWLAYQLRIRRLREHFELILAERNRIARELHDTLIQGFSGITMEMQALAGASAFPRRARHARGHHRGRRHVPARDAAQRRRPAQRSYRSARAWPPRSSRPRATSPRPRTCA